LLLLGSLGQLDTLLISYDVQLVQKLCLLGIKTTRQGRKGSWVGSLETLEGFLEGHVLINIVQWRRGLKLLLEVHVVVLQKVVFLLLGLLPQCLEVGGILFTEDVLIIIPSIGLEIIVRNLVVLLFVRVVILELFKLFPVCEGRKRE